MPLIKRKFIICTKDLSGLGFAKILKDEGHEVSIAHENEDVKPEERKAYALAGKGIVPKSPMEEVFKDRKKHKDAYWIFDMNHLSEYSEQLREEGYKVFGASDFQQKSEDDRGFMATFCERIGVSVPPTEEFSDIASGLAFLDANQDKAYVFKPDASEFSHLTFVPSSERDENANRELYDYLGSLKETGKYILQEKKRGVEVNFEAWLYEGAPFFAFANFECKKKSSGDLGENIGCAFDYSFKVPLKCKGVQETVGKAFGFLKHMKYTGFFDMNVIVSDNECWFLECCNRFGYNAHPNLFINLALDPVGDILADFIDGKTEGMDKRFRNGFGASVSLRIDHPRSGLPLYVEDVAEKRLYHFDSYEEKGEYRLAGYGNEVGIVCGHGYTMQDAGEAALDNARKINFPDKSFRDDITSKTFRNSPLKRYEALQAMKFL